MIDRVDLARALRVTSCITGKPFDLLGDDERATWLHQADEVIKWLPARHVAPAEPVTLTDAEWESFEDCVISEGPQDVLNWFHEHGFAFVRTGGAE